MFTSHNLAVPVSVYTSLNSVAPVFMHLNMVALVSEAASVSVALASASLNSAALVLEFTRHNSAAPV